MEYVNTCVGVYEHLCRVYEHMCAGFMHAVFMRLNHEFFGAAECGCGCVVELWITLSQVCALWRSEFRGSPSSFLDFQE